MGFACYGLGTLRGASHARFTPEPQSSSGPRLFWVDRLFSVERLLLPGQPFAADELSPNAHRQRCAGCSFPLHDQRHPAPL